MTRNERWILSEWRVANDRIARFSERLIMHRERTPFGEVDLILSDSRDHRRIAIEVKSRSSREADYPLLSHRQKVRLARARHFLEESEGRATELLVAVVDPTEIVYLPFIW